MIKKYNINDYLKGDKELQKAVIQELLDDLKCAVMNVENLLETKQRLKSELTELKAENEKLREINHELAEEHKNIGQDLYAEIKNYRKEKEKLKQQLEIDKKQINYFIEENEKQKKQIKQLEDFIKSDGEIDHINHEYTYKLRTCLQEIKEIAEQSNVDCIYRISVIRKILTKEEE